jgi:hypothetical protein
MANIPKDNMPQRHQLHILVGCADARDLSQLQIDTINNTIASYRQQGKYVQVQTIRAAGSFVSKDVYQDIKNIILNYQKEIPSDNEMEGYYVHIQSHGHLTDTSKKDYVSHLYDMQVVDGSPLNCGMLGASSVGIEIEQLIMDSQLEYRTPNGMKKVMHDYDIRELLRDVYAHDGFLAGDWVKSIDLLRTHPRAQKSNLEAMINNDPDLKRLGIKITAGIMDYSIHGLIRLDFGIPEVPFWDLVQKEIRDKAVKEKDAVSAQNSAQKPLAGLISMADPRYASRAIASEYYYRYKKMESPVGYLPNTLFNITGSMFDIPSIPFGPYAITGFYYAVKHLKLNDQMVMGGNKEQTLRIMNKIASDPIMSLIVRKFDVNLIPISQDEIINSSK